MRTHDVHNVNMADLKQFRAGLIAGMFALSLVPSSASASEIANAYARSSCIALSLKLGSRSESKTQICYEKNAKHLAREKRSRRNRKGRGLDALLRSNTCSAHFRIDQVPEFDDSANETDHTPSKSFLKRFQKRLIPFGKRVADCYVALAKGRLKANQFRKGRLVVELEINRFGRAKQVVLTEATKLNPHVAGCVIRELCGFWGSAPASGRFYLELPFSFKKLKTEGRSPPQKSRR